MCLTVKRKKERKEGRKKGRRKERMKERKEEFLKTENVINITMV